MWSSFVAQHACFAAAALCCKHPAGGAPVDYGGRSVRQSERAIRKSGILIGRTFSVKHTQ